MKVTNQGDVAVYTVAGDSTSRLPEWLARRRKRSLKNDPEYQSRVELIQDFEFEEASQCIRLSEDGEWIMSTGTYKPQMHVHYLPHLSLSYARHTTSLNTKFLLLSTDYSKSIHLQSDRKLELHTPMGCHYELRIPRYGRDLVYDRVSTEALVPSVGLDSDGNGEVFRLNLEIGRFMKSYHVDVGKDEGVESGLQGSVGVGSVNTAAIAESSHNLAAFGTSIGTVEFWDPRSKSRVAVLGGQEGEITALDFSPSGLSLATGSSNGMIKLFDLRTPVPLLTKEHGPGFPIKNIIHMTTVSQERKILSADKRLIKIWDEHEGDTWTSVEPTVDLNDVAWCKNTGMLLTANEGQQQHAFFIPQLGPAPRWCSFLDNISEELAEEVRTDNYENYKFLTLPELRSLSMDHLIGKTNLLRPYMHGYFVASKLYEQARLIVNPYAFEEERAKRIKEKVEKARATRIRGNKKVKVNQKLADKLLKRQEKRGEVDTSAGLLGDERFARLFEDEEFKIDETSAEFRALNPSTRIDPGTGGTGAITANSSDEEGLDSDDDDDDDESDASEDEAAAVAALRKEKSRSPKKNGGDDGMVMRVSSSNRDGRPARDTALGSRAQKAGGRANKSHRGGDVVGEQSVTFIPESRKKNKREESEDAAAGAPATKDRHARSDARRSASNNVFRRI